MAKNGFIFPMSVFKWNHEQLYINVNNPLLCMSCLTTLIPFYISLRATSVHVAPTSHFRKCCSLTQTLQVIYQSLTRLTRSGLRLALFFFNRLYDNCQIWVESMYMTFKVLNSINSFPSSAYHKNIATCLLLFLLEAYIAFFFYTFLLQYATR